MSDIKKDFDSESNSNESNGQVLLEEKIELKKPDRYRVVLLNDDYTPMEFVVWILQTIFHKSPEVATKLMLDVHQKGRGVCGVYSLDVAETKVYQVKKLAEKNQHPLECVLEIAEA